MNFRIATCLVAILGLSACSSMRTNATFPVNAAPSPNFDERRPNLVVIHHTSNATVDEALRTLTSPLRKVSAHYLIGRDGRTYQLVDEGQRAWHAGKSWWGGMTDINSISLGIELDNDGFEPFSDAQIDTLLLLLADIRLRYRIPAANFVAHADIAPTRKDDPSAFFPWEKLAAHGFGLWCKEPSAEPVPATFDLELALAAIGYDPRTPEASRESFRLHFMRGTPEWTAEDEKAMAYCVLRQKNALQGN